MAVREVKPAPSASVMQCAFCHLQQARIGKPKDWGQGPFGYVCGKDACRAQAGMPKYRPPDA